LTEFDSRYDKARNGLLAGILVLLAACATLPPKPEVKPTLSLPATIDGPLAKTAQAVRSKSDGNDALLLLKSAREGIEWRLAIIDSARASIDVQYFTWADDTTGNLVMQHLWAAANRGVRVRLLVDDLYLVSQRSVRATDKPIAVLDAHPNIEVKIFNPGKYRSGTTGLAGNFLGSFKEFNRRMHNKLLLADGHFAILGGRNLADEYYGLHQPYNFLDLDVMVTGPVIERIGPAFDQYWISGPAYPASGFDGDPTPEDVTAMETELARAVSGMAVPGFLPREPGDWSTLLQGLPADMHVARTVFLQDNPEVLEEHTYRLYHMLEDLSAESVEEVIIVTPYLIPTGDFVERLHGIVDNGARVRMLTASLASGDHSAVHAHYKKYRREILDTGLELYEFSQQPNAEVRALADMSPVRSDFIALHPKVFVADRRRCFVGSLNLDPRALDINTENGLLIHSKSFCNELADLLEQFMAPDSAWRVTVDDNDKLQWTSAQGNVNKAPARSFGQRLGDFFFRWLPLENQL
jgi:putative cardiolipin synthase